MIGERHRHIRSTCRKRSSRRRPSPGRGALAIVRLSGPEAHAIARRDRRPWPRRASHGGTRRRCATQQRNRVRPIHRDPLRRAGIVHRRGRGRDHHTRRTRRSDHGRGSADRSRRAAGAPGEFTRRAVLNGKLDILQAEATGDLIDANSRAAQGAALRQLDGGLSRRVLALRDEFIGLEALIAYDIDFPEEDDGPIAPARIVRASDDRDSRARALLATARIGVARSRRRAGRARRSAERRQIVAVQRAARRELARSSRTFPARRATPSRR